MVVRRCLTIAPLMTSPTKPLYDSIPVTIEGWNYGKAARARIYRVAVRLAQHRDIAFGAFQDGRLTRQAANASLLTNLVKFCQEEEISAMEHDALWRWFQTVRAEWHIDADTLSKQVVFHAYPPGFTHPLHDMPAPVVGGAALAAESAVSWKAATTGGFDLAKPGAERVTVSKTHNLGGLPADATDAEIKAALFDVQKYQAQELEKAITSGLTNTSSDVRLSSMQTALIHGQEVPLEVLRVHLKTANVFSADLARGAGRSSLAVGDMLAGRTPLTAPVLAAIEGVVTGAEARHLARGTRVAPPVGLTQAIPATAVSQVPSFANTMAVIPDDPSARAPIPTATPFVAARQAAALAKPEFPLDLAYRLAAMVRAAQGTDSSSTFSLRKMQMWAHAYIMLLREGRSQKEAVGAAFQLAVAGKEYGEVLTFLLNSFNQVLGYRPELPEINPARVAADSLRHPASYVLEPLLRENQNVWLVGDTGAGKTFMVKDLISRVLGRAYIRIQGTGDMNVDDLLGGMAGKDGTTFFEYGPLPIAMGRVDGVGKTLYIDEPTTAHADVLFELQAVLEGDPLVLKKNRGERILPAPGFNVVMCDNTLGLGERPEFIGTKPMNEAFRDRFYFLKVEYMPEVQEKAIVERFIDNVINPRSLTLDTAAA